MNSGTQLMLFKLKSSGGLPILPKVMAALLSILGDVPASVRRMILENTGAELIRRKIWDGKGTRRYWENSFKKYGRKSAPASFRAA